LKAILFDLDDTLLNRDHAVDNLFYIILEKYYGAIQGMLKKDMLEKFKEYDKETMELPIKPMFYHRFLMRFHQPFNYRAMTCKIFGISSFHIAFLSINIC